LQQARPRQLIPERTAGFRAIIAPCAYRARHSLARPRPRRVIDALAAGLCLLLARAPAALAQDGSAEPAHLEIEAIADHRSVAPAESFWVAVVQHIQPGWHTYWVNPGDAGQATQLNWKLPAGFHVGPVHWPVPRQFRAGPLVTYGYEDEVTLLQEMRAPATLPQAPATLSVEARWLACADRCVPQHATAKIVLTAAAASRGSPSAGSAQLFAAARARLPQPAPWAATVSAGPAEAVVTVYGAGADIPPGSILHFLPLEWGRIDHAARQRARWSGPDLVLTLERGDLRAQPLPVLDGVLVIDRPGGGSLQRGFVVHAAPSSAAVHP
jgi:DsbC/DsbD-like thiol-disulfide interchange protein